MKTSTLKSAVLLLGQVRDSMYTIANLYGGEDDEIGEWVDEALEALAPLVKLKQEQLSKVKPRMRVVRLNMAIEDCKKCPYGQYRTTFSPIANAGRGAEGEEWHCNNANRQLSAFCNSSNLPVPEWCPL